MADAPDYTEQLSLFRRRLTDARAFRLPEGLPQVLVLPGGKTTFVPLTVWAVYEADWLPDYPEDTAEGTWALYQMSLQGRSGAIFWTLDDLRAACPVAADIVTADAITFLTDKNGSAPKWLTDPTTTDTPRPCPPPRAPSAPTTG